MGQQPVSGPFKYRVGDIVKTQGVIESKSADGRYIVIRLSNGKTKTTEASLIELVERPLPKMPNRPFVIETRYGEWFRGTPGQDELTSVSDGCRKTTWQQIHHSNSAGLIYELKEEK